MDNLLAQILELILTPDFGVATLRVTTPILFAAMGGLVARRAGILNLSLEGTMLMSALVGVISSAYVKMGILGDILPGDVGYEATLAYANNLGALVGFICGSLSGVSIALFLAYMGVQLKASLYLSGLAINTFSAGATVFILYMVSGEKGVSSSLNSATIPSLEIPIIKDIPIIGEIISGQNLMVYFAFISVALVYFIIMKTPTGLRIRAVGENAHAAESVGVNVKKVQFQAMALSGLFCGFGGVSLSMSYVSFFSAGMTAGKGFIGMSAMNLGNASPIGSMIAAFIFGMFDAMANILQSLSIPNQIIVSIPYAATLVGLVVFSIQTDRKVKKLKAKQK